MKTLDWLAQVHEALAETVAPGDWAVDATCGNGRDTLALARLTGPHAGTPGGRVFAFDVQQRALDAARTLLAAHSSRAPLGECVFLHAGHETMAQRLPPEARGRLAAVVFNLGYLPGGDKTVTTRPETTLPALETAFAWLRGGGLLAVTTYPAHPGGGDEAEAVCAWAHALPWELGRAAQFGFVNHSGAKSLWLAHKR